MFIFYVIRIRRVLSWCVTPGTQEFTQCLYLPKPPGKTITSVCFSNLSIIRDAHVLQYSCSQIFTDLINMKFWFSADQTEKNIQGSSITRSERQKMKSPSITWLKNIYSAPFQNSLLIINTMQQVKCKRHVIPSHNMLVNISSKTAVSFTLYMLLSKIIY